MPLSARRFGIVAKASALVLVGAALGWVVLNVVELTFATTRKSIQPDAGADAASARGASAGGERKLAQGTGAGAELASAPKKAGGCSELAAKGMFEDITPPEVQALVNVRKRDHGAFAIAADPNNAGTVYVGTLFSKLWKTTDCGATWTAIATGRGGADVNRGMNWTLVVDPTDSNVVYTNSGYGSNSLYKSVNGGVDWTVIWPPARQPNVTKGFTYNFVNTLTLNPDDPKHLLLTFHEECWAPQPTNCIAESKDGGTTWRVIVGRPEWKGSEGQVIYFLDNAQTWLWGSQSNGFWRSPDAGVTWELVPNMQVAHAQGSQIYRRRDGTFFVATPNGVWRSPDGKISTWKIVPRTGPLVGGLVSDGAFMYISTCYSEDFCKKAQYMSSPEGDGYTWTEFSSPDKISVGGTLAYDKVHRVLYSSNFSNGVWRVVVPR